MKHEDWLVEDKENWKCVATAKNQYMVEKGNINERGGLYWETKLAEGFENMDNWRILN